MGKNTELENVVEFKKKETEEMNEQQVTGEVKTNKKRDLLVKGTCMGIGLILGIVGKTVLDCMFGRTSSATEGIQDTVINNGIETTNF